MVMTEDEYREHIRRLVDTFPPVTPEQKAEIGAALREGVARRRAATTTTTTREESPMTTSGHKIEIYAEADLLVVRCACGPAVLAKSSEPGGFLTQHDIEWQMNLHLEELAKAKWKPGDRAVLRDLPSSWTAVRGMEGQEVTVEQVRGPRSAIVVTDGGHRLNMWLDYMEPIA